MCKTYTMHGYTFKTKEEYIEYMCGHFGISPDEYEQMQRSPVSVDDYKKVYTGVMNRSSNGDFTSGVFLENTQYPEIIKCSINIDKFQNENYMTKGGYVRFMIKKSKSGKWYAVNPKY